MIGQFKKHICIDQSKFHIFSHLREILLNGMPNVPMCPTCYNCSTCPRAQVYFTDQKIRKCKLCTHTFLRVLSLILDLNFAISLQKASKKKQNKKLSIGQGFKKFSYISHLVFCLHFSTQIITYIFSIILYILFRGHLEHLKVKLPYSMEGCIVEQINSCGLISMHCKCFTLIFPSPFRASC